MIKLVIFLVFSAIFCSCASEPAAQENKPSSARTSAAAKEMKEHYRLTSKGDEIRFDGNVYEIKQYDVNKDKKPDILNVFKKVPNEKGGNDLLISVKMMDLNHDSKIDVWRYFNEETMVDYWEYYKNGVIEKIEKDTDKDGKPDVSKMPGDDGFKSMAPVDEKLETKPDENVQEKPEDEIKVEIETSEEPEPAAAQPATEEAKPAEESK